MSQQYVFQLLSKIRAEDRQAYLQPLEEARQEELMILHERERQLQEILDKSYEPIEQITDYGVLGADGKVRIEKSVRTRIFKPPDVRAALGLLKVSEQRARLLGLDKKADETPPPPPQTPYDALPEAERVRIFMETLMGFAERGRANLQQGQTPAPGSHKIGNF